MGGILTHTIEDAPARPLLAEMTQFSPAGRLLNMPAQMAPAPAVLEAYVSIYFLNYAATELDVPTGLASAGEGV